MCSVSAIAEKGIKMNAIQNYGMTNYQLKTNNRKIAFKAGQQAIKNSSKTMQNINTKNLLTYFTTLFAGIYTAMNITSIQKSKTKGKQIVEKANQIMKYIKNLPEYNASNFQKVTAGCHSQKVQFGPIKMEDGSEATITFDVMDYSDSTAKITKTLKMKDNDHEWYASSIETKPYINRYDIRTELEENINRGETQWQEFYDRNTQERFNKKGKLAT